MSESCQGLLVKEFFPSTREGWRKHNPATTGRKMTRQEHIDNGVVGVEGSAIGLGRLRYSVYRDCFDNNLPEFEEALFAQKPWLASDEEFAKWQMLEPFDRFRLIVCGLPWNDETVELLRGDDGPTDSSSSVAAST